MKNRYCAYIEFEDDLEIGDEFILINMSRCNGFCTDITIRKIQNFENAKANIIFEENKYEKY